MNNVKVYFFSLIVFYFLIFPAVMSASPGSDTIPPDLKKWKSWVLHGMEERFCPTSYNDGEDFHCLWPTVNGNAIMYQKWQ